MQRAKNIAESANEAKSRYLAALSHELRTPLNAILGFSDIIQQQTFGPVGNESYVSYATDIHKSGEHLLSLINDLLDLSKIEAGKLDLDEESLNLEELIEVSKHLLKKDIDDRKIEFSSRGFNSQVHN